MSKSIPGAATRWFREHGRDLPWRQTRDPYCIWVSEIMLQQTQVATVIPYYHRFLTRFPDIASLAAAPLDELYRLWAGLGYYRRARQMHEAAQVVVEQYSGRFPTDHQDILRLPGIGRYTASAIASFAWDARHGIVEANTQRLYARLLRIELPLENRQAQTQLWEFAESMVRDSDAPAGATNQALMEIGSQICTPRQPQCLICPLQAWCRTAKHGDQDRIPVPKTPKVITDLTEAALLIENADGEWLMRRCLPDERWAGLWDFPRFDITACGTLKESKARLRSSFRKRFGVDVAIGQQVHSLKHSVTRYRIQLHCFKASLRGEWSTPQGEQIQWCTPDQLDQLALCSSGTRLWHWLLRQSSAAAPTPTLRGKHG